MKMVNKMEKFPGLASGGDKPQQADSTVLSYEALAGGKRQREAVTWQSVNQGAAVVVSALLLLSQSGLGTYCSGEASSPRIELCQ